MIRHRVWILAGVAVLLAILAAFDQFATTPELEVSERTGVRNVGTLQITTGSANPLAGHYALSDFDEILRRPMFAPDRKPEPDIVPLGATNQLATGLSNYELKGTVAAGSALFALLREKSSDAIIWISQGKSIGGWTLQAVDASRATFVRNGTIVVLKVNSGQDSATTSRPGTMDPQLLRAAMAAHPVIPTDAMLGVDASAAH